MTDKTEAEKLAEIEALMGVMKAATGGWGSHQQLFTVAEAILAAGYRLSPQAEGTVEWGYIPAGVSITEFDEEGVSLDVAPSALDLADKSVDHYSRTVTEWKPEGE